SLAGRVSTPTGGVYVLIAAIRRRGARGSQASTVALTVDAGQMLAAIGGGQAVRELHVTTGAALQRDAGRSAAAVVIGAAGGIEGVTGVAAGLGRASQSGTALSAVGARV